MDEWMVALLIFGAITVAMIGQGWVSLLEHQRRKQAMEVIKAAIEAGKEAPPVVYEQLGETGITGKPPWTEVVIFTALSFGFWIAYGTADEQGERTAFLVVAATMTVTALGCLALALLRPGGPRRPRDHDGR
jgi:hypothetical protein